MKLGVLFSGGKDSAYSAYLAKKAGNELACLITLHSKNKESYMFHTPSISQVKKQAEAMGLPLMASKTLGVKEKELKDLEKAIKSVIKKYKIEGIVTGALHSVYQASRIQKICDNLGLKCFNPLWHKDEISYLNELINNGFKVIVTGVFAYPLNQSWLGRIIDNQFIDEVKILKEKYKIHAAGEGGEFETFVLNCPMFRRELKVKSFKDIKEGENSWRREIKVQSLPSHSNPSNRL
ncbi:MAG: diphthine--ammonia ligase [Candidatus Nanoarchaeia archaeon]|nr:diphthine--ammonia ligase [Candidatus Nanoarchaeia archaeon]